MSETLPQTYHSLLMRLQKLDRACNMIFYQFGYTRLLAHAGHDIKGQDGRSVLGSMVVSIAGEKVPRNKYKFQNGR